MKLRVTLFLLGALAAPGILVHAADAQTAAPAATAAAARPASQAKVLKRAEIDALLAQPDKVLVLDVRRPDELQSIGGFPVYLSVQAADLEKHLELIPRDRRIITVSNHSSRAGRAADLLAKNGFTVVGAVGAQDYEAEGGTLVKIAQPAPRAAAEGAK